MSISPKPQLLDRALRVLDQWLFAALSSCGVGFVLVGVVGGLVLFGWQLFKFLQTGIWFSLGSANAVALVFDVPLGSWWIEPQSWLGVHRVIEAIPAALGLLIAGLCLGWLFSTSATLLKGSSPWR